MRATEDAADGGWTALDKQTEVRQFSRAGNGLNDRRRTVDGVRSALGLAAEAAVQLACQCAKSCHRRSCSKYGKLIVIVY